jgi:pyruvate,water dikinase
MVRSDLGCAGVMFTIDTESGFDDIDFNCSNKDAISFSVFL